MAAKSDFAQKLLHDLRVRKERMASAQNSTTRVAHGNTRQTSRGPGQINTPESVGSRSGNTSMMSNIGNNNIPINTKESSNQVVLYENSRTSKQQVRDLSTVIAFALRNNGNLTNIRASTANPLVNFFNQTFGRKSRDTHKTGITSYNDRNFPTGQFSDIHISEVSKGAQKLNNIIRACSNGFTFETSSIEVGKELLKGAIDLEESLRMLVNFQEASHYGNTAQKKSRLKLVDEEDEDDQHKNAKIAEQWKLDRPKFSFDKPSKNSHVVQNATIGGEDSSLSTPVVARKKSTIYVQDLSLSMKVRENNNNNNSISSQLKQEKTRISNVVARLMGLDEVPHIHEKCDSNKKQRKISKEITNLSESSYRTSNIEERSHHIVEDSSEKKRTLTEGKRSKIIESENKTHLSNTEVQHNTEKSQTRIRNGYKSGENSIETRKRDKEPPINRQEKRVILQEHVLKRDEHSQEKSRKDKTLLRHSQNQNSIAGTNHESRQVESMIPSKSKNSTPTNLRYKLSQKVPTKDPSKRKHQDGPQNKEIIKKQDPILDTEKGSGPTKEETVEVSAKPEAVGPKKVGRSEIPRKIDVLMSRRNANVDHSSRRVKQPANFLTELKQHMRKKYRKCNITEEQGDVEANDVEANTCKNRVTMSIERVKQHGELRNEYELSITPSHCDEYQIQHTRASKEDCNATSANARTSCDDLRTVGHARSLKDKIIEQSTKPYNNKQEQLTEPEKHLKEIIIKSQIFLSTAEALFKLNIPVSFFLHASEQEHEVPMKNNLVLNCAHEVTKRKASRHENANYHHHHPYTKTNTCRVRVRSLDDLIKQVCRDLDMIHSYGGNVSDGACDVAEELHKMLEKDVYDKCPDVNSMWDYEWRDNITSSTLEKEDITRDIERYMLEGLLDEITIDLV